jgi:uncharacterized protein YjiS (DUF1127 family)
MSPHEAYPSHQQMNVKELAMRKMLKKLNSERTDKRAKRQLEELTDRLRADVGLEPKGDRINDWMIDPSLRTKPRN